MTACREKSSGHYNTAAPCWWVLLTSLGTLLTDIHLLLQHVLCVPVWFHVCLITDLRISSLQCGLFNPSESSFTSGSCRSLWLRSNSIMWQFELRAEDNSLQLSSVRSHLFNLSQTLGNTWKHEDLLVDRSDNNTMMYSTKVKVIVKSIFNDNVTITWSCSL